MADIFISYARADWVIAKALAESLTAAGYELWWDVHLIGIDKFRDVIQRELRAAKAVVVIWSKDSAASSFVRQEADEARQFNKLISTRVDGFQILDVPLGFREQHIEYIGDQPKIIAALEKLNVPRGAASQTATEQPLPRIMKKEDESRGLIRTFFGHQDSVYSLAFAPDGRTILSGSRDKTAKLWDVTTGEMIWSIEDPGPFRSVAIAPDGRSCITASLPVFRGEGQNREWVGKSQLCVREISNGNIRRKLHEQSSIGDVAISGDGKYIAIGGNNSNLIIWKTPAYNQLQPLNDRVSPSTSASLSFLPDSRFIIANYIDKTVRLWDIELGRVLRSFGPLNESFQSTAVSPDSKIVAVASYDQKTIDFWNLATGKGLGSLQIKRSGASIEFIPVIEFSPDGSLMLFVAGNSIELWDLRTRRVVQRIDCDAVVSHFSPDGGSIITGSRGGPLELWEVRRI